MKKLLTILVSVLIIGALFISCSQQVQEDMLGSVSISLQESKGLSAEMTSSVKSIDQLVWYYTATKTSGLYATGQTSGLTVVPADTNNSSAEGKITTGSSLGYFSTGKWEFSFYGFDSQDPSYSAQNPDKQKAVYYAEEIEVTVVVDQTNPVNIPLSVGNIAKGKVVFTGLSVDLSNLTLRTGGTLSLTIKQNGVAITDENIVAEDKTVTFVSGTVGEATSYALTYNNGSSFTLSDLDPGTYTFVFSVSYTNGDTIEIANEEWQVTVNNGTVVTFTGDVIKTESKATVVIGEVTGETKGEATIAPTSLSQAQSYTVAVSPASVADPESVARTTVSFPANVLDSVITEGAEETLTSSKVEIKVTDTVEASTTFTVVGESSSAFAGINLDLYKTVTTTATAESTTAKIDNPSFAVPVTVETYIAKGLTGVTVEYTGTGDHPVASDISGEVSEKQAHVYATDAAMGEKLGYSQQSGLLRFTTTHFSEFAVGAEQNVYDKTTNTAYKLCEDGANKGKLLNAAGEDVDASSTDEYVLLDSSLSNTVADSIDNYNAGYNWSVIYKNENEKGLVNHNLISGSGSKVDPYSISSGEQWTNLISSYQGYYLSNGFGNEAEAMYVVLDWNIDMTGYDLSSYTSYPRNFHLDGKNHTISNLSSSIWGEDGTMYLSNSFKDLKLVNCHASNDALFSGTQNKNTASVLFDNVDMDGCSAVGGAYQYYDGSATARFVNCDATNTNITGGYMASGGFIGNISTGIIYIDNCSFGGSVVSTQSACAGFVGQSTNYDSSKITIQNSRILSGTVIRNVAGGSVAAFNAHTTSQNYAQFENTFAGRLETAGNAYGQGTGVTNSGYTPICTSSDFTYADGTITYTGEATLARVTVQCYVTDDYIYEGEYYGGYNWYVCDPIKVSNLSTGATISGIPIITDFYNVVSSEDTPVGLKTTDTTYVDEIHDGVFYFDARTCSWGHYMLGGTYKNSTNEAIEPKSLNVYIRITVYEASGIYNAAITGSGLKYVVDLSNHGLTGEIGGENMNQSTNTPIWM